MRFATLEQWLAWQETLHPRDIDLGLERIAAVLARMGLGSPEFTVVTIAGTNGKGSSAAMLESILVAGGYRVGCYTSPHLVQYNERIRIRGEPVADESLCEAFQRVDQARGETSLSYFEFGTLAAIALFQAAALEIAILEVGLGGRLDAVNVLDADVALITAIDVDHQDWLGTDRETIGREKAGIMRSGRPVVCSDAQPPASVLQHARDINAPLSLLGRDFNYQLSVIEQAGTWSWQGPQRLHRGLAPPALAGAMQFANAAGVLMVLDLLVRDFPLDREAIEAGLQGVRLAGRFQQLSGRPLRILDVAHNPQSAAVLSQALAAQACAGRTRLVLAMLADKDIPAVQRQLKTVVDDWYLAPLDVPRGATLAQLQAALAEMRIPAQGFASVNEAYAAARQDAAEHDRIVVAGSFYTVAAVLTQTV